MKKINEAEVTSTQIKNLFRAAEKEHVARGDNRSKIGKAFDKSVDYIKNLDEKSSINYIDPQLTKYRRVVERARGSNHMPVSLTEAGIKDIFSNIGAWAKGKGKQLANKVSYESLMAAWQEANYPSDSVQIEHIMRTHGVSNAVAQDVFDELKIPYSSRQSQAIGSMANYLKSNPTTGSESDKSPGSKAFRSMQNDLAPSTGPRNAPFSSMVQDLSKGKTATPVATAKTKVKATSTTKTPNLSPEMKDIRDKLKQASRPLSMTPDAIRKRNYRAAQRQQSMPANNTNKT